MGLFLALITDSGVQNVQQIPDCDTGAVEEHGAEAGFEPGALPADPPRTLTLLTLTVFQIAESCKS